MPSPLKISLDGTVVVIGMGNRLRSDDGIGSIVAEQLHTRGTVTVFDAGVNLENYHGKIVALQPDRLIIVDAVDFGGSPGEIRILPARTIETVNLFSTHNVSISLFIHYVQSAISADIIILAVQPKSLVFGETLSPEVAQAARTIEEWFDGAEKER